MRFIMLIITMILSFFVHKEITGDFYLNKEIYNLYINGFKEFLLVDKNYYLQFDENKVKKYFLSKGYDVEVSAETNGLCIKEKENSIFTERVQCCFYMVINNETE